MSYETIMKRLSAETADQVAKLWAAVEDGRITLDDFLVLATDLIATSRAGAALIAQGLLRAYLEAAMGQAIILPPGPIAPDHVRLTKALTTIVASDLDTVMQLVRLATNEPLDAAARAHHDAMQTTALVSGWRRRLEADACQLCTWWWREGRVWQKNHPMPRHPGCACHAEPVVRQRTDNYQTTQQAAGAARSNELRHRKGTR